MVETRFNGKNYSLFEIKRANIFQDEVANNKRSAYLIHYPIEELLTFNLYLFCDNTIGYAITPKKEITNLFNNSNNISRIGSALIQHAISNGGREAFCFEGYVSGLFRKNSFIIVDTAAWSDHLAPRNWNYTKDGTPNVVWLKY